MPSELSPVDSTCITTSSSTVEAKRGWTMRHSFAIQIVISSEIRCVLKTVLPQEGGNSPGSLHPFQGRCCLSRPGTWGFSRHSKRVATETDHFAGFVNKPACPQSVRCPNRIFSPLPRPSRPPTPLIQRLPQFVQPQIKPVPRCAYSRTPCLFVGSSWQCSFLADDSASARPCRGAEVSEVVMMSLRVVLGHTSRRLS